MRSQVIYITQLAYMQKWTRLCLFVLVGFALSACGGGNSFDIPEPPTDTTSPKVETSYPDDNESQNFEIDYKVEITFSELMNIDSLVNKGGIKLFSGRNELNSDIDLEERDIAVSFSVVPVITEDLVTGEEIVAPATKASITHASGRFALNTDFTVTVELSARDQVEDDPDTEEDERNFIASSNSLEFSTEQGEWKQSTDLPNVSIQDKDTINERLVATSANQFSPRLIANAKGDSFLIWRQELSTGINQLWVSRYIVDEKNWRLTNKDDLYCVDDTCANAQLISTITDTSVIDYDVAINELGHLAVVWSQASAPSEFVSIWGTIFDGKDWHLTEEISSSGLFKTGNAESPSIALDSKGNAVSIWRELNGQYSRVKTNIFKVGAGSDVSSGQWVEAPVFIDSHSQVISKNPQLSMNDNGFAVAVWEEKSTGLVHIYSNHIRLYQSYDWIGAERIDEIAPSNPESGIGNSSFPSVVIDQNNDALAIWLKHDGQRNNVWFNRFTGSWGALSDYLEQSRLGDASFPRLTIGKTNRALAYWVQDDEATNSRTLYSSFFTAFTGWESERSIASDDSLVEPVAFFDREGNAAIQWQEGLTKGDIKTRYYSKRSDTWGKEEVLGTNGTNITLTPLLEDGRFLTTWVNEQSSEYRLRSILFSD